MVIPAYKATFLRETLESIAMQTDKRFHLYIGDDCSPHNLREIVDEFKDRIPLTYHLFETNLGGKDLVGQWNRCIALTNSEPYIWLFSDDDVMEPRCVESFYNHISSHSDDELIHFNIKRIDEFEKGRIINLPNFPLRMSAGEFLEAKLSGRVISFVVEFIFSRKLYELVGGFEKFDLAWGSDFMTWLKMAVANNNGIVTLSSRDNSCIRWRSSAENISPNRSHPILMRKIKALIQNAVFIKNLMKKYPEDFKPLKYSFQCVRFPLGEIYRSRKSLGRYDIIELCREYYKCVGFIVLSMSACLLILIKRQ